MSDKRFFLLDETIFDNEKQAADGGRVTYWAISYAQRQRLVDLLNELSDENGQLKEEISEQQDTITEQEEHIKLLTQTIERMIQKINTIYELSASERSV